MSIERGHVRKIMWGEAPTRSRLFLFMRRICIPFMHNAHPLVAKKLMFRIAILYIVCILQGSSDVLDFILIWDSWHYLELIKLWSPVNLFVFFKITTKNSSFRIVRVALGRWAVTRVSDQWEHMKVFFVDFDIHRRPNHLLF